jgi:hypothetical protein
MGFPHSEQNLPPVFLAPHSETKQHQTQATMIELKQRSWGLGGTRAEGHLVWILLKKQLKFGHLGKQTKP